MKKFAVVQKPCQVSFLCGDFVRVKNKQGNIEVQNMSKYDFEKDIPEWSGFVRKCIERVLLDNEQFHINSQYVPHTVICPKPDYCFVAMEPVNPPRELEIDLGYKSFGDWHVNYCAYHYLCNGKFKYHVTDIAKGALPIKIAHKTQEKRYKNWLPLLKKELELLGNPKAIIAIGKTVYNAIKYEFKNVLFIESPASTAAGTIEKAYSETKRNFPKCNDCIPTEAEWRNFIKNLMEHCGWEPELIETRDNGKKGSLQISKIFKHKTKKKLFAIYKYKLEEIKNNK